MVLPEVPGFYRIHTTTTDVGSASTQPVFRTQTTVYAQANPRRRRDRFAAVPDQLIPARNGVRATARQHVARGRQLGRRSDSAANAGERKRKLCSDSRCQELVTRRSLTVGEDEECADLEEDGFRSSFSNIPRPQ
jgi:hypothetical protein